MKLQAFASQAVSAVLHGSPLAQLDAHQKERLVSTEFRLFQPACFPHFSSFPITLITTLSSVFEVLFISPASEGLGFILLYISQRQ